MTRKGSLMANDWLQLCDDIDDGDYDGGLNEIAKAIQSRRDVVVRRTARRLQRELKVGDKVKLTNGIKPRYLQGMVGHIERMKDDGSAVVKLTKMPVRTGAGRPSKDEAKMNDKFTIPFEYLVKIGDDSQELGEVDLAEEIGDDEEYEDEDEA